MRVSTETWCGDLVTKFISHLFGIEVRAMEHRCPVCGAAIAEGSAMCSSCSAGVRWQNGKPTPALEGKFASQFWKLTFAVMVALAAFLLLAYWLLRY
jgi:hypothetical protein